MKWGGPFFAMLCALTLAAAGAGDTLMLKIFDFSSPTIPWPNIDDVVMGGVSASRMVIADGVARFEGAVSLDRGGGFASVRSPVDEYDLGSCDGLRVRVRGDGKSYSLRLRTTAAFDGVSYQATLQPPAGEWVELEFPFSAFEPVFRGRRVPDHPPLDPSRVRSFGLLIADRQAGAFQLELDWIACSAAPANAGKR